MSEGASPVVLVVKNPPVNAGDIRDTDSIPGSERPPRRGHSNPLKYSCLGNPMDRGAWWSTVYRVAQSQTLLKRLNSTATCSRGLTPSCCSVAQLRPALCNPMDCSTPGFLVPHHLPELAQTHVHWVGDTIRPSHPLSSPSPPAVNLSQHWGLFQWVSCSHQVADGIEASASVLPMNIQGWFPLALTHLISLQSKGLSGVFSTPQLKSINFSALSFVYSPTHTSIHDNWKNHSFD